MKEQEILKQLENLEIKFRHTHDGTSFIAVEIRELLENYLHHDPQNTKLLFKMALAAWYHHDEPKAIDCLEKILSYEPDNGIALIMIVEINHHYPLIDDNLYKRLCDFRTNNHEILSMIEYMKTKYFLDKSMAMPPGYFDKQEQECLKKSIELCDSHFFNYVDLAKIYLNENKNQEALELLLKALFNIKKVYADEDYDFFSAEHFINDHVTGVWLTHTKYVRHIRMLRNLIEQCNSQINLTI